MTPFDMYEKSFLRPTNFFKLSQRKQWEIDEMLGILDWDGSMPNNPEALIRFSEHYDR